MGPNKDSSTFPQNQDAPAIFIAKGRQRRARRPRRRTCLLKGCGQVFRPQQPLARYCSEACQAKARQWRQWKARRHYRQSLNGKQKRRAQSRRYRERRKERQAQASAAATAARVIPTEFFFVLLRPPGLLCGIRSHPAVAPAALLLCDLSPGAGTGFAAGEALARTRGAETRQQAPQNLASSAAIEPAHIVPTYCTRSFPLAKFKLRTQERKGERGPAKSPPPRSLFFFMKGQRAPGWNWNFINSHFVTSG